MKWSSIFAELGGRRRRRFCSSRQDFLDAASVADVIGIEIGINFAAEYKDRVFAGFRCQAPNTGRPHANPDVLCNAEIKFKAFLDHAMRLGAEDRHHQPLRPRARGTQPASASRLLRGWTSQDQTSPCTS